MLLTADKAYEELEAEHLALPGGPAAAPFPAPSTVEAPARYGEGRRFNPVAIALTVLFHAVLIFVVVQVRQQATHEQRQRLTVVDLTAPPPPPPAATRPPEPKSAVAAPVPLVQAPRPAPQITLTPAPVAPSAPSVVAAPPAPAAAPGPPAPPAPPSPVEASNLGTRMISAPPPRYPLESRRQREQGTVVLALTLDLNGSVATIAIAHSSGFPRLDEAALRAVRKWRWAPTVRDGQPVMVRGQVEIPFMLQG
ncbi:energy transducer TonB [Novosphingobium album (ex Liu et al. 2023)]|uniref:Energy transducer TonB n=1 Tax=Novosphingobium album (ex Liu et al. 2023) TaxID=3031130 RepID=A0ABT5WN76_9SPHN|nr:energy transducer TonB [Novosphingobium album (ex Liu et al. 2023)]MDE8651499.1 energy transducer TonB [Novosphingobium album (ex Liu et al. 2023)]